MQEFVRAYWQNLEDKKLDFQSNVLNLLNKIAQKQEGFIQINPYDTYNSLNPNFSVQNLNATQAYILLREDEQNIDKIHKEKSSVEYANLKGNLLIISKLSWIFVSKSKVKKFKFDSKNPPDDKQTNSFLSLLKTFLSLNVAIGQELGVVIQNLASHAIILRHGIQNKLKIEELGKEKSKIWQTYTYFSETLDAEISIEKFADDLAASFVWTLILAKMHSQDEELSLQNASSFIPKSSSFLKGYLPFLQELALNEFDWIAEEVIQNFNYLAPDIFDFENNNDTSLGEAYQLFCSHYHKDSALEVGQDIPQELAKSIAKNLDLLLKSDFEYKSGLANRYKVSFLDNTNSNSLTLEILKVGIEGVPSYSPRFGLTVRKFLLQKIVSQQSKILPYLLGQIQASYFFNQLSYPVNPPEKWQFFLGDFCQHSKIQKTQDFLHIFKEEEAVVSQFREEGFLIISTPIFGDFDKINQTLLSLLDKTKEKDEQILTILIDNSFLQETCFRIARAKLLTQFNKVLIFDLHGNQKIAEINQKGELDANILNKQEGVALLLCIKKEGIQKMISTVDIFGQKEEKLAFLVENDYQNISWQALNPQAPNFALKHYGLESIYQKGYPVHNIFKQKQNPLKFQDKDCSFSTNTLHKKRILCRPFDFRWVVGVNEQTEQENYYLHLVQKNKGNPHTYSITKSEVAKNYFEAEKTSSFPLYQYQKNDGLLGLFSSPQNSKSANFTQEFRNYIQDLYKQKVDAYDVLAYIYLTLWTTKYRSEYAQFLKEDYPRIPFPKVKSQFKKSAALGKKLIQVHCFEKAGDKLLDFKLAKVKHQTKGKRDYHLDSFENMQVIDNQGFITLKINQNLFIENIPKAVYEFQIGNSKIVQNYLLARQKRILNQEQIDDFARLIRIIAFTLTLKETHSI